MTTEGGRPGWPGGGGSPGLPPAGPPPTGPAPGPWGPGPAPGASPPAATVADAPPPGRPGAGRGAGGLGPEQLKIVVAVLIGAVSVTVAVLTFRAAILGEQATDKDRQAVAETVIEQQTEADAETQVQDERSLFATFAATVAEADALEASAVELRGGGDEAGAVAAETAAIELRQVADQQASLAGFGAFTGTDADGRPTFDVEGRQADLERRAASQNQVDSRQTVADARILRQESQRLVGWVIPLVVAVVLLTLAQISRRQGPRVALAGSAVVVWLASTGLALLGGS